MGLHVSCSDGKKNGGVYEMEMLTSRATVSTADYKIMNAVCQIVFVMIINYEEHQM